MNDLDHLEVQYSLTQLSTAKELLSKSNQCSPNQIRLTISALIDLLNIVLKIVELKEELHSLQYHRADPTPKQPLDDQIEDQFRLVLKQAKNPDLKFAYNALKLVALQRLKSQK